MPIVIAMTFGLGAIIWLKGDTALNWRPVLLGSLLMFGLGFLDDLKPLGAKKKFIGQILIATLLYKLGMNIDRVTYPGARWSVELHGVSCYLVSVFWLIAIPNIVNLIDGFDGLASGLGLFMAMTLGIVASISEQLPVAWYAFTLAGALLGFLMFNFPPARIFLGDGGAYLIGFCIAALSLTSSNKGSIAAVLMVTVVGLGIPILDTTLALFRRAFRGFPLFHADDEHIHHRLENLGFSKRRIVLGLYGICVVLSMVGLSIIWSKGRTIPIAIGVVFLLAIFAVKYLQYVKTFSDIGAQVERVLGRRRTVQYALLQAQLMELEIDRCEDAEEFWTIFRDALSRVGFIEDATGLPDKYLPVEVKYNGSKPWILLAPEGAGTIAELQRLAECFRTVYIKAKTKWGT
ncbi:MAG TPA: MraY family glycosyltransferase [Chthoniobacteraceae bacterium]|nr:MraY family glycosyltransferase [Chthoniobacteraceae bacterium]